VREVDQSETVLLGSSKQGVGFAVCGRDAAAVTDLLVSVRDVGLFVEKAVVSHYASGFADLVAFVEVMAENWRGWQGEQRYRSLEGDLTLTAKHDGHVQLSVELRENPGWRVQADFTLDPGEQMTRTAAELRALLDG
jgi:hypothetical protein